MQGITHTTERSIIISELGSLLTLDQYTAVRSILEQLQAKHFHGKSLTIHKENSTHKVNRAAKTEGWLTINLI